MSTSLSGNALEQLKKALFRGDKIGAIKIYREATNCELITAKNEVEKFEGELRQIAPDQFKVAAGKSGCAGLIALALVPAFGLMTWLVLR